MAVYNVDLLKGNMYQGYYDQYKYNQSITGFYGNKSLNYILIDNYFTFSNASAQISLYIDNLVAQALNNDIQVPYFTVDLGEGNSVQTSDTIYSVGTQTIDVSLGAGGITSKTINIAGFVIRKFANNTLLVDDVVVLLGETTAGTVIAATDVLDFDTVQADSFAIVNGYAFNEFSRSNEEIFKVKGKIFYVGYNSVKYFYNAGIVPFSFLPYENIKTGFTKKLNSKSDATDNFCIYLTDKSTQGVFSLVYFDGRFREIYNKSLDYFLISIDFNLTYSASNQASQIFLTLNVDSFDSDKVFINIIKQRVLNVSPFLEIEFYSFIFSLRSNTYVEITHTDVQSETVKSVTGMIRSYNDLTALKTQYLGYTVDIDTDAVTVYTQKYNHYLSQYDRLFDFDILQSNSTGTYIVQTNPFRSQEKLITLKNVIILGSNLDGLKISIDISSESNGTSTLEDNFVNILTEEPIEYSGRFVYRLIGSYDSAVVRFTFTYKTDELSLKTFSIDEILIEYDK